MILDRYLMSEVIKPLFVVVLLLIGVFMAYSLTRFLTDANEGLLSASAVFQLTWLKVVIALEVLVPIGLYMGIIVTLGRLYSDSEIVALKAGGVSEARIALPVITLALIISLLVSVLSLWVRPWAYSTLYEWQARAEADIGLDSLETGQFHIYADEDRMVFLNEKDRSTGEFLGLFVRSRTNDALEIISAHRGRLSTRERADAHRLTLLEAFVYKQVPDQQDLVGFFREFSIWIPALETEAVGYKPKARSSRELLSSDADEDRAEIQWRASTFVSTFLLAMVAFPLSRTHPRSGRHARVLLAVIIYMLYFNFMGIARSGVEQGTVDHLWWAPAMLALSLVAGMLVSRRMTT